MVFMIMSSIAFNESTYNCHCTIYNKKDYITLKGSPKFIGHQAQNSFLYDRDRL